MTEVRKTEAFARWLDELRDLRARARVQVRIERLAAGNAGDVKAVGEGVSELRIDYGPGYRVYYPSMRGSGGCTPGRGRQEHPSDRCQNCPAPRRWPVGESSMSSSSITRYDVAEHLRTPEERAAYLEACLEEAEGDAAFIAKALWYCSRHGDDPGGA